MLWTIAVILVVLWLLGVVTSFTMHGFIHILLVIAIIGILAAIVAILAGNLTVAGLTTDQNGMLLGALIVNACLFAAWMFWPSAPVAPQPAASVGAPAVHTATFSVVEAVPVPLACPVAEAVIVVVSEPVVCPAFALTVMVTGALVAPGARVTAVEFRVDALNATALLSDAARLKETLVHADPLSLFVMVTE